MDKKITIGIVIIIILAALLVYLIAFTPQYKEIEMSGKSGQQCHLQEYQPLQQKRDIHIL
jgi:hypothetical protein